MSTQLLSGRRVHLRRAIAGIILTVALVTLSAPALAGGYAVVRLDEPPGDVLVATPWRFGFMVLQHDVTPNSDVTPVVRALHKESGEEITATGRQEGAVGHFVAEVTFPRAGEWKWSIEPLPYAETSFETLTVLESPSAVSFPAQIVTGSCALPGDVAFSLGDVEPQATAETSAALPLAIGVSVIDTPLSELLTTGHAIGIGTDGSGAVPVACGEISGTASDDGDIVLGLELAVPSHGETDAENVGVAVLREEGERTVVTLYLLNPNRVGEPEDATMAAPEETLTVEIVDPWVFQPHSLEIPSGATVIWVNNSDVAHTVTGDDLAFDDSGLIEPGGSFRQTFDEPGTYSYRCGPHPDMTGVIVVT
jgi:plastocyanin